MDNTKRLDAQHQRMDTPPDRRLAAIMRLVPHIFGCSGAGLELAGCNGLWMISSPEQADRVSVPAGLGFCPIAPEAGEPLVLENAWHAPRFAWHPAAVGRRGVDQGVGFYAGIALREADGMQVGTLFAMDPLPRSVSPGQIQAFKDLASLAEGQLASRTLVQTQSTARRMALAVQAGGVGVFEINLDSGAMHWDPGMYALCGLSDAGCTPTVDRVLEMLYPGEVDPLKALVTALRKGRLVLDVERRLVFADGSIHHLRLLGKALKESEDAARFLIGTCWDVTEARVSQQQLSYQATHDALTGLYNRFEFERRLKEVHRSRESEVRTHALCFIDLDRFKIINDTAGHAAGDALLRELGQALACDVRSSDVLARLGGDEFGLLLVDCSVDKAERVAEKLIERLAGLRFQWADRVYSVSASIGIAQLCESDRGTGEAMSQADVACYAAKSSGRGRVSIYRPDQSDAHQHHRDLLAATSIREALETNRFCLYAQAIVPIRPTGEEPPHYELLVRMRGMDGELVPPNAFIPAAERYGLMMEIDRWVLREALVRQAERIAAIPGFTVSLNLSAQSLNDRAFLPYIEQLVQASPLPAERIHMEITETAAVMNLASAGGVIAAIRALGCAVALDDFGSGLSSFNYLKHFSIDYVKIDGTFISALKTSTIDRDLVESMHQIAHKLGARTIAEYVEDDELLALVRGLGIDFAQGFGIGKPTPLESVLKSHRIATLTTSV